MQTGCTTSARRPSPGNPILPSPLSKLYCCQSSQGEAWCHLHSPRHSRLLPRLLLGFPNHGSRSVMTGGDLGGRGQQQLHFPISQPLALATITVTLKLRSKNSEPSFSPFILLQSYRDPGLLGETRVHMCVHAAVRGLGWRWGLPSSPPPASSLHLSLPREVK